MDEYFNNMSLVLTFLKWKWHLLVIIILAALVAIIVSSPMVIKPKYRSSAIFYPSNITSYSDESETEQMLQWLNSRYIMDSVIHYFNLAERYEISPDNERYHSAIQGLYQKNVRIRKTPYEAIEVEVYDHDPNIASQMVDSIISFANQLVLRKHSEKYAEGLLMMETRLLIKQKEIDSIAAKLLELRTVYGIFDYPQQSREVARGFLRTVDGYNVDHINTEEVLKLKKNIEEKGGEWTKYNNRYFDIISEYSQYKIDYEWALVNANKHITYATVISRPFPADKKAYPIRWLILLYTLVGTTFFSILVIAVIENTKKLKDKINQVHQDS